MSDDEDILTIDEKLLGAVEFNDILEVIDLLIDGADLHCYDDEPIRESAWRGHYEITELLLERGANINAISEYNETPLTLACKSYADNMRMIEFLLQNGADITLGNPKPIIDSCIEIDKADVLRLLCEHGIQFDKKYVLRASIIRKHKNTIEFLLDKYPNITINTRFAIEKSDVHVCQFIKMLIDRELIDIFD